MSSRELAVRARGATSFDGVALLGDSQRSVWCEAEPERDLLFVEGAGRFAIARDGMAIEVDARGGSPDALVEALLGPALMLALARTGVFVLHASAVAVGGAVVGFLGESGAGKSTLARLLAAEPRCARAADDLLAVQVANGQVWALPHLPQLKLRVDEVAALVSLPARLPLRGLFELRPVSPADECRAGGMASREAVSTVVRHGVAAALFDADLLAAQLEFAGELATLTGLSTLSVPRRPDVAGEVLRCLGPAFDERQQ